MIKSKPIVVTGGAGFIGANLVLKLKKEGYKKIIVVDHITPKNKKNLTILGKVQYFDKNEFKNLILKEKISEISCIVHLGARSDTTETDRKFMIENNVTYSKTLFKYCLSRKIPFIYASSAATYGDGAHGYSESRRDLKPLNLYGKTKHIFDEWVISNKNHPPQWVGLKFFNVFGPFEFHKKQMASVVLHGFRQIKTNNKIRLFKSYKKDYANGGQLRDFVYVKDVIGVIMFFIEHPKLSGIYNVGTGNSRSFNDLAKATFQALGKKPIIEYIDMPKGLSNKYQYFTQAKMDKLKKSGYKKRFYTLEHAISDYVKNYLIKIS